MTRELYGEAVQVAPMGFERRIAFEGCFNFRDLGGYRTHDGRWLLPQCLYRADGPHSLSPDDVAKLRTLELATIIDLRTPQEVEDRGCYLALLSDAVEYHLPLVDVLPDPEELPAWIDPEVVSRQYRDMLDQGEEAIAEALAILSDPSAYPAMFHCSAGKDRTGVLAAVLLGVLGVPDDVIIADYALSADAMHRLIDYYTRAYPDAGNASPGSLRRWCRRIPRPWPRSSTASDATMAASTATPMRSASVRLPDSSAPSS